MNKIIDRLYFLSIDHFINYKKHLHDYFIVIALALFLRSTVFVIYTIPTGSMIPTFLVGDVVFSDRFYYGLKLPFTDEIKGYRLPSIQDPDVGDVVVFRAPREELYYITTIFINDSEKAYSLLKEINEASSFKRPINIHNGKVNYIFKTPLDKTSSTHSIIQLHHSVYDQYIKELQKNTSGINVASIFPKKLYHTYYETPPPNFLRSLISTPIAGVSIISSVLLDTPLGLPYKFLLIMLKRSFIKKNTYDFSTDFFSFSLYPNSYVDTTKDFVKRLIAKGGDVIEMKDQILYINEQPQAKKQDLEQKEKTYYLYSETISYGDKEVTYPVRYYNPYYLLGDDLSPNYYDPQFWPYDPNTTSENINFTKNFGPFTVPEDHYFFMGDNRDESLDSRFFGAVPHWAVKGRPFYRLLPTSRLGKVQ